jgi:heptosyltransferase-2
MRSLVIAPQWIGDAVMSEPLLRTLAARGERLTVAALPWVAPVYHAMPQVAEVVELPFAHGRLDWSARRRLGHELRGRFDTAYVLPNSLKAALIPFFARIPQRVGYQGEGRYLLLNRRLPNPGGRPPMVAFYRALSGEPAVTEAPLLSFPAGQQQSVTAALGLAPQGYWVFAPGAEYGPAKIWPASHYAQVARELHARHGEPVVLLGSGKEAALCEEIAAAAPGACRVLAGKTRLIDAMVLIAAARGVVSNDSGLMHVAAAFRIPQVAVFGSTSPELQLDCMPCFERTCRYGHYRCLTGVSATRVLDTLDDASQH